MAAEKSQFVGDEMQVRGRYCDSAPTAHAPTEDKSDDTEYGLCEELEHVFDQFTTYLTEICSSLCSKKVNRDDVLKPPVVDGNVCNVYMTM
jgi:hypothetical protein